MNRTRRRLLVSLAALGFALLSTAPTRAQDGAKAEGPKAQAATLKGTLTCLGCDLKKAHGAGAQCSVYGHKHALKTADGKYYTFLENAKSEPLIKGEKWHNKPLEVTGTVFPGSQVIEVKEYKVLEATKQTSQNTAAPAAQMQTVTLKVTGMS
jgi:hypothetical protein